MNTLTVVVFAAAVAAASAGLLGAPLAAPIAYGGVGQLSQATTSLNSGTYKTRISQSARPVAYAAAPAFAAPAYAAPAIAHPAIAAPAYAAPALAAPVAAGHVVTAYGYTPVATGLLSTIG